MARTQLIYVNANGKPILSWRAMIMSVLLTSDGKLSAMDISKSLAKSASDVEAKVLANSCASVLSMLHKSGSVTSNDERPKQWEATAVGKKHYFKLLSSFFGSKLRNLSDSKLLN